ncbi:MAG: hypothetical protein WA060_00180 [Minisyncoccia bacterium]
MERLMTVSYQYRGNRPMTSKLVIANHLLEKFGFPEGTKIKVQYSRNKILITKLKNNE